MHSCCIATAHLQVGVNIKSDATYLERDYEVKVANTVDVRTHAKACWVQTPSRSLAGMVSSLLGKALPKDPTIRLSRWSSPLNAQHVILVSSARVLLFALVVVDQALFVACLIVGAMLLNLLVGARFMISAF